MIILKNSIPTQDNITPYPIDTLTCFEKPTALALENYYSGFGSLYIILCKFLRLYKLSELDWDEQANVLLEKWFSVKLMPSMDTTNMEAVIKSNIDKGNYIAVGGNLRYLFYSHHYKTTDSPHLFLITGYDFSRGLIQIIDDTHISQLSGKVIPDYKYRDFTITTDILNDFIQKDDFKDCYAKVTFYEKLADLKNKENREILCHIFDYYISNNSQVYIQLEMLEKILTDNSAKAQIEETKKQCLKMNRFRCALLNEIQQTMVTYGCDESKIEFFKNLSQKLIECWDDSIQLALIKIARKKKIDAALFDALRHYEDEFCKFIIEYNSFLKKQILIKPKANEEIETKNTENNKDLIVTTDKENIIFSFNTNQIYNSWLDDECPKYILQRYENSIPDLFFEFSIEIEKDFLETDFQAGVFIRDDENRVYFAGMDRNDLLVLDIWGNDNKRCIEKFSLSKCLFLSVNNDEMNFGIIKDGNRITKLSRSFNNEGRFDVGLACKTWGNGKKLSVKFQVISLNVI